LVAEAFCCLGECGGGIGKIGCTKIGGSKGLAKKAGASLYFRIGAVKEGEGLDEVG
jgi:hypothetical protein